MDKLTRRSGTVLDEPHQDISGRKLRKSQEWDESVLHLAHAQPIPFLSSMSKKIKTYCHDKNVHIR